VCVCVYTHTHTHTHIKIHHLSTHAAPRPSDY